MRQSVSGKTPTTTMMPTSRARSAPNSHQPSCLRCTSAARSSAIQARRPALSTVAATKNTLSATTVPRAGGWYGGWAGAGACMYCS
ncbi:hypothetical protein FCH28_34580 [Streptomyces piniterrae]|uniref:Uncharacterized protein n=1 Tax=Streptomyces piniterrae TaxID=2571125 RepID=A0A4V5MHS0_9ACTN|nr:hypothetical protein FCH28_34580 [Streptomyces piniterrae]